MSGDDHSMGTLLGCVLCVCSLIYIAGVILTHWGVR